LIYKFEIWNELLLLRSFVNRFAHFCAFLHLGMQDIQLSGFFIISTVNVKNQIILKKKKELTSWCNKLTDAVVDNLSWPTSIRTFFFSGIFCSYLWERERLNTSIVTCPSNINSIQKKTGQRTRTRTWDCHPIWCDPESIRTF
jgi:hypothetical protein